MDLNTSGSWASIISLPLSIYALYQANNIRNVLRARALDSRVRTTFARLRDLRGTTLTTSARIDIVALIQDLNDFYLAKFRFLDAEPKRIIERIKTALQVQPNIPQLKRDLESLESLIFTSTRV